MNLIEQLGGYEKAKEETQRILNILDNGEFLGGGDAREGFYERLDQLEKCLLQYRRQHNIFDVGDKVVFINQNMSSSVKAVKEILNDTHVSFNFHGFHIELIRHATDAEIEAGKRLGVK